MSFLALDSCSWQVCCFYFQCSPSLLFPSLILAHLLPSPITLIVTRFIYVVSKRLSVSVMCVLLSFREEIHLCLFLQRLFLQRFLGHQQKEDKSFYWRHFLLCLHPRLIEAPSCSFLKPSGRLFSLIRHWHNTHCPEEVSLSLSSPVQLPILESFFLSCCPSDFQSRHIYSLTTFLFLPVNSLLRWLWVKDLDHLIIVLIVS